MSENRDEAAHEKIGKIFDQMDDMRSKLQAIEHELFGINLTNGMRSELKELRSDFDEVVEKMRHWRDVERIQDCLGAKRLDEHLKGHASLDAEESKVRTAEIAAEAAQAVARENARTQKVTQLIVLIGMLATAIIPIVRDSLRAEPVQTTRTEAKH